MPSRLTDEAWLREQVAAYRTAREIADELGVTDRAVRYALRRYDIERPPRQDLIDVALAEYRAGTPLAAIAAKMHRSKSWVQKVARQAGAQRPSDFRQRQPPKYPQLHDVDWLRAQLDAGGSIRSVAKDVGTDRHTVRKAMARHGLDRWPAQLAGRFQYAVELEAEARRRQARVVDELLVRGHSVAKVAASLASRRRRCDAWARRSRRWGPGWSRSLESPRCPSWSVWLDQTNDPAAHRHDSLGVDELGAAPVACSSATAIVCDMMSRRGTRAVGRRPCCSRGRLT